MSSRDERGGLIWKPQTRPVRTATEKEREAEEVAELYGSMTGGHGQAPPPPPPAPQQNGAPPHIPLPVTTMLPGQAATPIDGYPGNHLYEAGIRAYIPESHRHLLDLLLHARTTGNPMLVPLVLDLLGIQNILGTVHGTPPVFFITSVLTADDYNSLLVLPCYNTLTFTAFVAPNVTPRMMRPIQLRGILEIEYSDENVTLIAMSIRGTLQGDPRVWQAMDMFHDAVAPPPWQYDRGAALDLTLNNCPTRSFAGEEHWRMPLYGPYQSCLPLPQYPWMDCSPPAPTQGGGSGRGRAVEAAGDPEVAAEDLEERRPRRPRSQWTRRLLDPHQLIKLPSNDL
ncbi:hypothetical protein FA13DRAFT_1742625 [Coprinellus micaceus]|uniref:Uncharacterized protein n=1 Tax=Coprinellus micaceus TaxID=71717 RepID=A0A4Y7SHZ3_COPMI|nr:hypothetical protein FA13DRAFT_1742625 [Coprinellus micaceus]